MAAFSRIFSTQRLLQVIVVLGATGTITMKAMHAHLEKIRRDAAQCALIRDLATDPTKRELFTRMARHLVILAGEVETAIAASSSNCV